MSGQTKLKILSHSEADTEDIGQAIGLAGRAGDVVGLVGQLGAGKTRLVKGIARGLAVAEKKEVKSPTFVIIREHTGRLRLFHVDAYRLSGPAELWALGLEEMLSQGLIVVEWAERVADSLPIDRLTLELDIIGPGSRRIRLSCGGPRARELLGRIQPYLAKKLAKVNFSHFVELSK